MDSLKLLDATIRSHRQQRYNLELALEVAPRNSRYSNNLINLMQREEISLREGRQCSDLSREVEAALASETRAFFSRMSDSNVKRWNVLLSKSQKEKDALIRLVREKCRVHFSDNFVDDNSRPREVTPIDLEIESLRLEQEYNRHWKDIEEFHINEAFKSQKARIDAEWGMHLDGLNDSYDKKIRSVTGDERGEASRNAAAQSSSNGRWHNAEKQKTLIHTAPVLSPNTNGMAVGSGVRAVRKKGKESAATRAEIERIDRQHKHMVNSLMAQKANAVRWMRHQETRLISQSAETHASRLPIAKLLEIELALLHNFRSLILNSSH